MFCQAFTPRHGRLGRNPAPGKVAWLRVTILSMPCPSGALRAVQIAPGDLSNRRGVKAGRYAIRNMFRKAFTPGQGRPGRHQPPGTVAWHNVRSNKRKKPSIRWALFMAVREGFTRARPCALPFGRSSSGANRSRRFVEPGEGSHPPSHAQKSPAFAGLCLWR